MFVVLAEDDAGELGVLFRGKEDEPAVIAQVAAGASGPSASLV
jgi:hypothetical protein